MAKPNYQFEKRQRELAKKKKKEEKAYRKSDGSQSTSDPSGVDPANAQPTEGTDSTPTTPPVDGS